MGCESERSVKRRVPNARIRIFKKIETTQLTAYYNTMTKGVLPMEKNSKRDLTAFFNPKSVAIIGASSDSGSFSGKPLYYLLMHGYKGKVYPINPSHDEIQGVKAYKSILDLPETPDHVVLAVNAKLVLPMLEQCVQKGVKFATLFAAGFAEADEEGKALQRRIVELCKESGMGIGLSLCRRIIEAHGGELWVDRGYLNGALFGFKLPVAGEPVVK